MSSTRYASEGEPLSQGRYMSSPEYAALRGVSGSAVTAKASITMSARKRALLFFLQSLSLEPGGLRAVAERLVEMFPDRAGADLEALTQSLMDICINPRVLITDPNESRAVDTKQLDMRRALEMHDGLSAGDFYDYSRHGFKDLHAALFEFQKRTAEREAKSIARTTTAQIVYQTLDACLEERRMVLIEGNSDAGKSTSAEAWCRAHRGEAIFVRLQGITNKTVFFRAIARALGLASGHGRKTTEMAARVEDMLHQSRLCLVLDESQYCFAQGERISARPELIDWIYTACCNHQVPVALIASPLFSSRLHQAERQTIWNSDQFRRRIYRHEFLPEKPTRKDIDLVARHRLPDAPDAMVKYLAAQAVAATHPFTAIDDTLADARQIAKAARREKITFEDVQEAVKSFRTATNLAKFTRFDQPRQLNKRARDSKPLHTPLNRPEEAIKGEETEDTFTAPRAVAAREVTPANSGKPLVTLEA